MSYNFSQLKESITATEEWLKKEYFTIRSGRAAPQVLDSVRVDMYGTKVPLNQSATISVDDARTLVIAPYDLSQIKGIEKAVVDSNLGLSVASSEKGVRVSFPQLTTENRAALVKVVKDKLEQSRVSMRKERDEVWNEIQKQEKDGEIGEDDKFRYKEEMQKLIDDGNKKLEDLAEKKEGEILGN